MLTFTTPPSPSIAVVVVTPSASLSSDWSLNTACSPPKSDSFGLKYLRCLESNSVGIAASKITTPSCVET